MKSAQQPFTELEQLQVRQDIFSRDGAFLVKAGSVVVFHYLEPDTNGAYSRCSAVVARREHYLTLPTHALWRPTR